MNEILKRFSAYYLLSGMLFVLVLSGIIMLGKYEDALVATASTLQKARGNLMRTREAGSHVNSLLMDMKMLLPDSVSDNPERLVLKGLDEMKSRLKDAEITITNIEYKGDEIILPVHMKARMKDYAAFVNMVGYLQSMRFPFFIINTVSLAHAQDKEIGAVLYEIKGELRGPGNIRPQN